MPLGGDLPEDLLDLAVRPDDEGRPLGPHVLPAVVDLLLPGVIEPVSLQILVAQQGEVERVLVDELRMRLQRVPAHAEDDRVQFVELREVVPERAGLYGAPGSVVLRVEVQDDLPSFQRAELHRLPRGRGELEVRRTVSYREPLGFRRQRRVPERPAKKVNDCSTGVGAGA